MRVPKICDATQLVGVGCLMQAYREAEPQYMYEDAFRQRGSMAQPNYVVPYIEAHNVSATSYHEAEEVIRQLRNRTKTPTIKRNRLCKEWIDGTTLHSSPSSGSASCTNTDPGIAWLLYEHCLTVLPKCIPLASRKSFLTIDILETLKEVIGILYLWRGKLEDGRLDSAISQCKDLEDTTRDLLLSITDTMWQWLLHSLKLHAEIEEGAEIEALHCESQVLIEKARMVVSIDNAKDNSDCESLYSQDSDEPWDDIRTLEFLKTTASCLMDLLPSIEQALAFLEDISLDYLRSFESVSGQTDIPMVSSNCSEIPATTEGQRQLSWHTSMILLPKTDIGTLSTSPEPGDADAGMEDPSKSHLASASVFHDSSLGTSQSSCVSTTASPSSAMPKIEEDEDMIL